MHDSDGNRLSRMFGQLVNRILNYQNFRCGKGNTNNEGETRPQALLEILER